MQQALGAREAAAAAFSNALAGGGLSAREQEVMAYAVTGLMNKQIAAELGLAENTVKVHVTAILKKLACYSRTQAAVLVKSLEAEDGAA